MSWPSDGALGNYAGWVLRRIWNDKRPSTPESHGLQLAVRKAKHFFPDQPETWQSRLFEMGTVCRVQSRPNEVDPDADKLS